MTSDTNLHADADVVQQNQSWKSSFSVLFVMLCRLSHCTLPTGRIQLFKPNISQKLSFMDLGICGLELERQADKYEWVNSVYESIANGLFINFLCLLSIFSACNNHKLSEWITLYIIGKVETSPFRNCIRTRDISTNTSDRRERVHANIISSILVQEKK